MNLIDHVLDMCDEVETPRSYLRWATLAAISAIIKRQVYVEKYFYRVYPNVYVMLVGPPGITKSYATNLSRLMVESVNSTKIVTGQNSIEGILEYIASSENDEKGVPKGNGNAEAFIVADEFTTLVLDNPQAFSILTDLYDSCYKDEWPKRLKSGTIKLKKPYVTMITATNIAHFNDKLRQVDVEGGFIGRTMVILEKERYRINSLLRKPKMIFDVTKVREELIRISKLEGEFKFDKDSTLVFFENWDREFKEQTREDTTGIFKRMPDSVLKVAMLNTIAEGDELVFTKARLERAIEICRGLITNIRSVTAGVGSAANSQAMVHFMQCLIGAENHRMEHKTMLNRNYSHFDTYELAKIVETLTQAGVIRMDISGSHRYYQMTDDAIVNYMRQKES
jgi:hypothetical protein